jgi:hypothetical protein
MVILNIYYKYRKTRESSFPVHKEDNKMTRSSYEIKAEISALRSEISDLYNQSQWMSASALDRVDDLVGLKEDRIKVLYGELEKIEANA